MRSLSILFFLSIISLTAFSQIKWSEPMSTNKTGFFRQLASENNQYYYLLDRTPGGEHSGGSLALMKMDKSLILLSEKKLDLDLKKEATVYGVIRNDELFVFYTRIDMSKNIYTVQYDLFDLEGNRKERVKLYDVPFYKTINYLSVKFKMTSTQDKESVGIVSIFNGNPTIELNYAEVKLSDPKNPISCYKKHETSIEIGRFYPDDLIMDNKGNAVVKCYSELTEDDYPINSLIFIEKGCITNFDIRPTYQNFDQFETQFQTNKMGETFVSGVLRAKKDEFNIITVGFFLGKVNFKSGKLENVKPFYYKTEFFNELGYSVKENGTVDFEGKYEFELIPSDNGGGFLIAEHIANPRYYKKTFRELVVYHFESDVNIDYRTIIPRHQGENSTSKGYFAFIKENQLYLLYNGFKENFKSENAANVTVEEDYDHKNSGGILTKINSDGTPKKDFLFLNKELKGFVSNSQNKVEGDKLIIGLFNKGKVRYGTIKLD